MHELHGTHRAVQQLVPSSQTQFVASLHPFQPQVALALAQAVLACVSSQGRNMQGHCPPRLPQRWLRPQLWECNHG